MMLGILQVFCFMNDPRLSFIAFFLVVIRFQFNYCTCLLFRLIVYFFKVKTQKHSLSSENIQSYKKCEVEYIQIHCIWSLEGSRANYSMVVQRYCPKRKNIFKPCERNIWQRKAWRIPLKRRFHSRFNNMHHVFLRQIFRS